MFITQKPNQTLPPIKYAKFMNTVSLCVHDAHVKLNTFIKKNLYNLLAHQHIYSSSLFMRNQFFNSCSNTWETNPSVPWQRAGFTNLVIKIKAPELKKNKNRSNVDEHGPPLAPTSLCPVLCLCVFQLLCMFRGTNPRSTTGQHQQMDAPVHASAPLLCIRRLLCPASTSTQRLVSFSCRQKDCCVIASAVPLSIDRRFLAWAG